MILYHLGAKAWKSLNMCRLTDFTDGTCLFSSSSFRVLLDYLLAYFPDNDRCSIHYPAYYTAPRQHGKKITQYVSLRFICYS